MVSKASSREIDYLSNSDNLVDIVNGHEYKLICQCINKKSSSSHELSKAKFKINKHQESGTNK